MSIKSFQTIDGRTLMSTPLAAPGFVVSSLIPTGLHILGGSPKIGKSWLMLWLCLCVSKGERFWNYECRQGTALYLCLEDSFERIQSRLLDVTDDAPSCLHFSIMADSLDDGLPKQIESFLTEHPDTNLIVIDTLQNIRKETNNSNPYRSYEQAPELNELAMTVGWTQNVLILESCETEDERRYYLELTAARQLSKLALLRLMETGEGTIALCEASESKNDADSRILPREHSITMRSFGP